jgi:hypothetical protein
MPVPRGRPAVVIPASLALALAAALSTEHLAPTRLADAVAICVAWGALYPISRLKPSIPWWMHWVQGMVIFLGFWLATHRAC